MEDAFYVTPADKETLDSLFTPFSSIGTHRMLITAGYGVGHSQWNTMTASWGSFGVFWNHPTVTCVIRPVRYTYEFVEREDLITFSFFPEERKEVFEICGTTSGRHTDKASAAKITPLAMKPGAIGFAEASVVLVCKKLYYQDLQPEHFLDKSLIRNYEKNDFHRMYICEIQGIYQPREKK
ncbi:flavin reductase [Brucepastera parasyntrophica]|uniref:flavin reductase n=1 Tax=Brucepastera parasyntrophica TaxID=2880008 RepID=UPI00210A5293|nr:flavin reductase [Brucepastera parasyntrophica]ULQ59683.1 flavin reductase [Brucepastera parasyntrophica]